MSLRNDILKALVTEKGNETKISTLVFIRNNPNDAYLTEIAFKTEQSITKTKRSIDGFLQAQLIQQDLTKDSPKKYFITSLGVRVLKDVFSW